MPRVKGTLQYFKEITWTGINQRTINGSSPRWNKKSDRKYLDKGIKLEMTRLEYYSWCDKNAEKIISIYLSGKTPSIDRINSDSNYDINSIRVLNLDENIKNGGISSSVFISRGITACCINTKKLISFKKIKDVKLSGFNPLCVRKALYGKLKSYKGYVWVYNDKQKRNFNKKSNEFYIDDIDYLIGMSLINNNSSICKKKFSKPIIGTSKDGSVIRFSSIKDAHSVGFDRSSLRLYLNKNGKIYKGYEWSYA